MAGQLGELVVSLQADMARFREDMGKAERIARDQMRQISSEFTRGASAIEKSFGSMAAVTAGALSTAAVMAFAKETVAASIAAEKLHLQFKAAAGSAELAAKELGYVKGISRDLGLDFADTATAYGKFMAATRNTSIEGETSRRVFEGVSKAVTALGLRSDEAGGIFLALSQMMSKGKVSAEELNGQLGERLPGALKLAADGMGMTTAELMKQMQAGKIMSADLLPKLAAELEKTYGEAAVEASAKGQAGINRFKNEILETEKAIGTKLRPAIDSLMGWGADGLKTIRENPQGPLDHVFRLIAWAETGKLVNGPNVPNPSSNVDPQMARIEAERRARQEETNRQRAAAEKLAAGADERAKARAQALADEEKRQEAALRATNKQLEYQNQLLEKAVQDWNLAGLGSGLLDNPLQAPKPRAPSFSLTGAAETTGYNGNPTAMAASLNIGTTSTGQAVREFNGIMASGNAYKEQLLMLEQVRDEQLAMVAKWDTTEIDMAEKKAAALSKIDEDYYKSKAKLRNTDFDATIGMATALGGQMAAIMMQGNKKQFERGKKLAMAMAAVDTAAGIAKALSASQPPFNFIMAGLTAAAGAVQIATISSTQYEGREKGGNVSAGTPYIVGEKRPELFVPGQSGTIVPYVPQGGGQVIELTMVNNFSSNTQDAARAEIIRALPYLQKAAVQGVKAAMRKGELQG